VPHEYDGHFFSDSAEVQRAAKTPASALTFEADSGFTHVTARQVAQLPSGHVSQRPSPAGYPFEPLVSYLINRQLSDEGDSRLRGNCHSLRQSIAYGLFAL
jgi:hypothetical protein